MIIRATQNSDSRVKPCCCKCHLLQNKKLSTIIPQGLRAKIACNQLLINARRQQMFIRQFVNVKQMDLVMIGRAHLANPHWACHAALASKRRSLPGYCPPHMRTGWSAAARVDILDG